MFNVEKDQEVSENGNTLESSTSSVLFSTPQKIRSNPHYNRGNVAQELLGRFLDELPKMQSHYCRKDSTKLYLDCDFRTVSEVHKAYEHYCSLHQAKPLKSTVFSQVLHQKNLSLFKPKKDRCNTCIGYEVGQVTEKEWQDHMRFKDEANTEKETGMLFFQMRSRILLIPIPPVEQSNIGILCVDIPTWKWTTVLLRELLKGGP
ncbi:hypothetical protein EGW08_000405 [Elysia chlorotica]|uniref:Uncharacterized protein n=1 Tax=Elysia chlorotica TaxID=188477 RepID=A0A3S1A1Z2_ELYCH|nr:hypothetical protein EGW08_000405 [Elysia chlorotica]